MAHSRRALRCLSIRHWVSGVSLHQFSALRHVALGPFLDLRSGIGATSGPDFQPALISVVECNNGRIDFQQNTRRQPGLYSSHRV